uniref:Nitrous oxide reductase maturation protein NosF (ATPase) n=1 Tax=uncultured Thiotrichaceae bacterium TaxID=298394 RepID=A0A6S6U2F2_9GAMM|nr:MAG: Nitrous oxide reductase maturation protein NosF (ATPase) [uncultured Thiotrichaceae bacterium]
MIKISSLSRHYAEFKAVDDVSFDIQAGEVVGLLGHNGAGKTTIMKMMTGFLEPTDGMIRVDELEMGKDTRKIQKRIGYLPENCPVWPEMTVIDYLMYQAELHGVAAGDQQTAVARAIRRTALKEKAGATIQTLSRGYRQRVGVAQAILHDPDIIILDEPTNGLDPTQISQMRNLIRELAESATVILSTHILQEVQAVCSRVLIMRSGKLVVNARLGDLQLGQRLLLSIDNDSAVPYLRGIDGVRSVEECDSQDNHSAYLLEADADLAPDIAAAVIAAGDQLFGLQPEVRNLETVFAEVNTQVNEPTGKEAE